MNVVQMVSEDSRSCTVILSEEGAVSSHILLPKWNNTAFSCEYGSTEHRHLLNKA